MLDLAGIGWAEPWTLINSETAFDGWHRYVELKRQGRTNRRPVADILIGAFAMRFKGLITRNPNDFQPFYPKLKLLTP